MWDLEGRKTSLHGLAKRLGDLRAQVPALARAFHESAERLCAKIADRVGLLPLWIKSDEMRTLREQLAALAAVADGLIGLRDEAERLGSAERALTVDIAKLQDPELRAWFATRARGRADVIAAVGEDIADAAGLAVGHARLGAQLQSQQIDRRLLDLLGDAFRWLKTIRSTDETRSLAQALPGLCRRLVQDPEPSPVFVAALITLLKPLRDFQARPKPPAIEQADELNLRLGEWIDALQDNQSDPTTGAQQTQEALERHAIALRDLSVRYNDLSEQWNDHADAVFAELLAEFRQLDERLSTLAGAERGALTDELERNRETFHQLADAELNPGLADEIAQLLAEAPDDPERFHLWRTRCRRAREQFVAAIGADRERIEDLCDRRERDLRAALGELDGLPLELADRTRRAGILRRLETTRRPAVAEVPAPELPACLGALNALYQEARTLLAGTAGKSRRLAARRAFLRQRAERLRETAERLGEPVVDALSGLIETMDEPSGELRPARLRLIEQRRLLVRIETELLHSCAARIGERSTRIAELRALLDADLALGEGDAPPAVPAGRTPGIGDIETQTTHLLSQEARIHGALEEQAGRLRGRRDALLADLRAIDDKAVSGADSNTLVRLLAALADCDESRLSDPPTLVPALRNLIAPAQRLLERISGNSRHIDDLTARLNRRLASLQNDYDAWEVDSQAVAERIWALIAPVPGVAIPHAARRAQLQDAEGLLRALETQALRSAAALFALHWSRIKDGDDPQVQSLTREIGSDPRVFPGYDLRRRVRELAQMGTMGLNR